LLGTTQINKSEDTKMRNTKKVSVTLSAVMFLLVLLNPLGAAGQTQYSATDGWSVGPGDYIFQEGVPDCGGHEFDGIAEAAKAIAAYRMGGLYGSLASVLQSGIEQFAPKMGGDGAKIFDQLFGGDRFANCVPVSVVIPIGAHITGILYEASDGSGSGPCAIGQDCQVGWSRFDPPQYFNAGDSLVVTSVFRNWSADRTRNVKMTVYFTL
jgi:hypothetical protein